MNTAIQKLPRTVVARVSRPRLQYAVVLDSSHALTLEKLVAEAGSLQFQMARIQARLDQLTRDIASLSRIQPLRHGAMERENSGHNPAPAVRAA